MRARFEGTGGIVLPRTLHGVYAGFVRGAALAVLVIACGSSNPPPPATSDAGVDGKAPCTADEDTDEVCDDVDLCPLVYDPGQADLDGDHVGWACDSVESTVFVNASGLYSLQARGWDSSFGATLSTQCSSGTCRREIIAVSPYGVAFAANDSGAANDTWLAEATATRGPFVSQAGHMFWTTGAAAGELDPVTRTFVPSILDAAALDPFDERAPLELFAIGHAGNHHLVRPVGGQLEIVSPTPFSLIDRFNIRRTPTPARYGIAGEQGNKRELVSYTPGGAWTSLGANFDEVEALDVAVRHFPYASELAYCVRTGTQTEYIGIHSAGVTRANLPFAYCNPGVARSPHGAVNSLVLAAYAADSTISIVLVRGGQVTTVASNLAPALFDVIGTTVQAIVATENVATSPAVRVWAVTTAGAAVEVVHSLQNVDVSAFGDTIHVAGVVPGSGLSGTAYVVRYREATGSQTIMLGSVGLASDTPAVVTTAEGAAIIATNGGSWLVPSSSTTPQALALDDYRFEGFVRGTTTVFYADDVNVIGSNRAIWVYDELAGPRLTQLTTGPEPSVAGIRALDLPWGPPQQWFEYIQSGCQLARVAYTGTTPSLVLQSCPYSDTNYLEGRRANGDIVLANTSGGVWTIAGTTVTKVANQTSTSYPDRLETIMDVTTSPPTVVGWIGKDSLGSYACLASHPERCWSLPEYQLRTQLWVSAAAQGGDGAFAFAFSKQVGSEVLVTVVRTIDNGNRPQPLP